MRAALQGRATKLGVCVRDKSAIRTRISSSSNALTFFPQLELFDGSDSVIKDPGYACLLGEKHVIRRKAGATTGVSCQTMLHLLMRPRNFPI